MTYEIKSYTNNETNNLSVLTNNITVDCHRSGNYFWNRKCMVLYIVNTVVWNGGYLFQCAELA